MHRATSLLAVGERAAQKKWGGKGEKDGTQAGALDVIYGASGETTKIFQDLECKEKYRRVYIVALHYKTKYLWSPFTLGLEGRGCEEGKIALP